MAKIKICLLSKNASCNGTFNLDTSIYVTPNLFFGRLIFEQINFSHTVKFPLKIPKYEVCHYEKSKHKTFNGNKTQINVACEVYFYDNHICPGSSVSVDNFESRMKGRTYTYFVSNTSGKKLGGSIFDDHMSGYIHVNHKLEFFSLETIRDK